MNGFFRDRAVPVGLDRTGAARLAFFDLRAGVLEDSILDPAERVLHRAGDTWEEQTIAADGIHRTHHLPGLEARYGDRLGPPDEE